MRVVILCLLVLLVACSEPQIEQLPERSEPIEPIEKVEELIVEVVENTSEPISNPVEQVKDIDELKSILLKGIEGTEYHVTMGVTVSGNTNIESTTEIFVKDERSRVDTKATIQGQDIETRVIILEEEMISCINEGTWQCESFDIDAEIVKLTAEQMREQLENETFYTAVTRKANRRLAGVLARCYVITLEDMPVQEQCYSNEGAVLYQEFTIDGDHVVHRASAYSRSVDENVFSEP